MMRPCDRWCALPLSVLWGTPAHARRRQTIPTRGSRRTSFSRTAFRRRIALAAFLVFLIDSASKNWALSSLGDGHVDHILRNFLELQLTTNSGAAFNLATSKTYFLTSFSSFALLALFLLARRIAEANGKGWALPLGLAIGGVMGNLNDRIFRSPGIFHGSVIDWIRLPHWPTFNIADSSLVIAALWTLYLVSRGKSPWVAERDESESGRDNGAKS